MRKQEEMFELPVRVDDVVYTPDEIAAEFLHKESQDFNQMVPYILKMSADAILKLSLPDFLKD